MNVKLEEFHTLAQADLPMCVQRTIVNLLADDEVCRDAVETGITRQHLQMHNTVRREVLTHTLPALKKEFATKLHNKFCRASAEICLLEERAQASFKDHQKDIRSYKSICKSSQRRTRVTK